MNTYISLLRGINVTGKKRMKMEELRTLFISLGFKNVKTYIQSGNVIFNSDKADGSSLVKIIESGIKCKFGFDVSVHMITPYRLREIIANNPFPFGENKACITFLFETPQHISWDELKAARQKTEQFEISEDENVVYLHCPLGYARTKLSNNFFERKLKVSATTRNLKTLNKLLEL